MQQKTVPRLVADLQRNVSAAVAAAEARSAEIRQELDSLELAAGGRPGQDSVTEAISGQLANLTAQVGRSWSTFLCIPADATAQSSSASVGG